MCFCLELSKVLMVLEKNIVDGKYSIVEWLSNISETIQNIKWLIVVLVVFIIVLITLLAFRKRSNNYTKEQIKHLIDEGKYIPGVFVELNNAKEIIRYFIYSKKWKKRIIDDYNLIYDNYYGVLLKKAFIDFPFRLELTKRCSLKKIINESESALSFHNNIGKFESSISPDYEMTKYLFEIVQYPYREALESVNEFARSAESRYFVLTGSAGNGKTNLLCSISQLLINLKETVIFINAKDIKGDITDYIICELIKNKHIRKYKRAFFRLINILFFIEKKHLILIIDAVNENSEEEFRNNLSSFINSFLKLSRVKIIVSCRNEYYEERFKKCLVNNVNALAFEFDLKEQNYNSNAIERIINAYKRHFNYSGHISEPVKLQLSKQLLLMRIFFETNKDKSEEALTIRKHELFYNYIDTVKNQNGDLIIRLLDVIADNMLNSNRFDKVNLDVIYHSGFNQDDIDKAIDSSILLSKKIEFNKNTIARSEEEYIFFVFDEIRDYYLSRRVILNNTVEGKTVIDPIISKVIELNNNHSVCAEGITNYIYTYLRTDDSIAQANNSKILCNRILDLYRTTENSDKERHSFRERRDEFSNLGLRIIMTSGMELADFEIEYIQHCLISSSREDVARLFNAFFEGTLYDGVYNINTFLYILFGIRDLKVISSVISDAFFNPYNSMVSPVDLIKCHYDNDNTEKKQQIQMVAELFLLFYKMGDKEKQKKLEDYFYSLENHMEIMQSLAERLRRLISIEDDEDE